MEMFNKYTCINCGSEIKALYKQYSQTVLKLTTCEICDSIADKYIEFDPVIIIIDLVLLSKSAYRHILYNTNFKIHWKIAIMLQIAEAYLEYALLLPNVSEGDDLLFYKMCSKIFFKTLCFTLTLCALTVLYNKTVATKDEPSLLLVWKAMTLSSFGILLLLPSIIWKGMDIQSYYVAFVTLYTTLSQLIAYTVVCRCPKLWSIVAVIASYYVKANSVGVYNQIYLYIFGNN